MNISVQQNRGGSKDLESGERVTRKLPGGVKFQNNLKSMFVPYFMFS
jgi:hypothetical protein